MSLIRETEKYIKKIINSLNMEIDDIGLVESNRIDLGQYQINCAMNLAKKYHKNPIEIANLIISNFDDRFENVNIAGPGFINISFKREILINNANDTKNNTSINIDYDEKNTIVVDYGGANACKALHIGHMRSANIGESLKRLAKAYGHNVIGDWHLGDLGRQSGMLITELKQMNPNLPWFDKDYKGEYPKLELTIEQLGEMYPKANLAAKENEDRMEEVRNTTALVEKGYEPYVNLWKQMLEISEPQLKEIYNSLNCTFDTFNGEFSSLEYLEELNKKVSNFLIESEGAQVIDVKNENDKIEFPPLIVYQSNGATIYNTRDLCTLIQRMKDHNPNEIWYVIDKRQELALTQVFRGAYKTNIVPSNVDLKFYGFGTINGQDGKPYKTRDGGVMTLKSFIDIVKTEISKRISSDIDKEKEKIINDLSIATIKFADLSSNRTTDYIFDLNKFCSFEGKTGPYILYTLVRIKSILTKGNVTNNYNISYTNNEMDELLIKLVELPTVLKNSYNTGTLHLICDYLYNICNIFNKFYNNHNILSETNEDIKNSYIGFLQLNQQLIEFLLEILAINTVERM